MQIILVHHASRQLLSMLLMLYIYVQKPVQLATYLSAIQRGIFADIHGIIDNLKFNIASYSYVHICMYQLSLKKPQLRRYYTYHFIQSITQLQVVLYHQASYMVPYRVNYSYTRQCCCIQNYSQLLCLIIQCVCNTHVS